MNIYTSYFANLKHINRDIIPISIALHPPKGYTGLSYPPLFPTQEILNHVKATGDHRTYILNYTHQVLNKLNPNHVLQELSKLSNDHDIALICYESPDKFCHRKIVSKWLSKHGYQSTELISDKCHPSAEQPLF